MLPAINYITLIDKYVLSCLCFIFLTALESALIGAMATPRGEPNLMTPTNETPEEELLRIRRAVSIDAASFYAAFALFIAIHVGFACFALHPKARQRRFRAAAQNSAGVRTGRDGAAAARAGRHSAHSDSSSV